MPEIYYGKLRGIARAEAFSVAGIAQLDQLQGVLDSLDKALTGGADFRQWKEQILKAPAASLCACNGRRRAAGGFRRAAG